MAINSLGSALLGSSSAYGYDHLRDQYHSEMQAKQRYFLEEQMRRMQDQAAAAQTYEVPKPDSSTNPVLLLTGEDE